MYPIVLIHGFPLDASMWEAQVEHLRSRGHSVVALNLPGFGGLPPLPREQATLEAFAEHVHHAIEALSGKRAIVGGFSMGGYTLLALLESHPQDVAAAMFIDTRSNADSPEARTTRLKSIENIESGTDGGRSGLIDTMLAKLMAKKPTEANRARVRAIMERQPSEGIIGAQLAMSKRRDRTELLGQLAIPALIVVGAEDAITPPSVALAMQAHMPHAMLVQIVSAGHMSPMEQPAAVNAAIDTFLATTRGSQTAKG